MNLSNYTEEILIKNLVGLEPFPPDFPPAEYYLTVFIERNNIKEITDEIIENGNIDPSTGATEPDVGPSNPGDGLWQRLQVNNLSTEFEIDDETGASTNINRLEFEQSSAEWGNVIGVGIFDADIGGRCLYWMNLDEPVDIYTDDTFVLLPNSLQLKFD
jgi:hypothetical protein